MLAFDDGRSRVYLGHVLEELAALEPDSVHCVVTSPPYWGLRDYKGLPDFTWGGDAAHAHEWGKESVIQKRGPQGDKANLSKGGVVPTDGENRLTIIPTGRFCACGAWRGQLGLEPTPDLYVAHIVEVFEAVRRVLRPDGTCWLNLGDCYTGSPPGNARPDHSGGEFTGTRGEQGYARASGRRDRAEVAGPRHKGGTGLKPKDLVGIPWRVAFALQAAGWWLRSDIVWAKPNPMPESVTDRPTRSHEYLFLLAKSERYFYDADAIRENFRHLETGKPPGKEPAGWQMGPGPHHELTGRYPQPNSPDKIKSPYGQGFTRRADKQGETGLADPAGPDMTKVGFNDRWNEAKDAGSAPVGRNKRSVWTISTAPYPEAHFATFPPDLVRPCIQAGTSERGACSSCGVGWGRVVERSVPVDAGRSPDAKMNAESEGYLGRAHDQHRRLGQAYQDQLDANPPKTTGWEPGCACAAAVVPATILDPFLGSGTTLEVAASLGRRGVGVEGNPTYLPLIEKRLRQGVLL